MQTLRYRGEGGGGHPDPKIRGGPGLQKFFSALRTLVWSKSKGVVGPPGPSPGSATEEDDFSASDTGGSEKRTSIQ